MVVKVAAVVSELDLPLIVRHTHVLMDGHSSTPPSATHNTVVGSTATIISLGITPDGIGGRTA